MRSYKWIVASTAIVATLLAIGGTLLFRDFEYRADAQLLVVQYTEGITLDGERTLRSTETISQNLTKVISTTSFMDAVLDVGNLSTQFVAGDDDIARMKSWDRMVEASSVPNSGIIRISAYHPDTASAERLAQAVSDALIEKAPDYHGADRFAVDVKFIDRVVVSPRPVRPNLLTVAIAAFAAGAGASILYLMITNRPSMPQTPRPGSMPQTGGPTTAAAPMRTAVNPALFVQPNYEQIHKQQMREREEVRKQKEKQKEQERKLREKQLEEQQKSRKAAEKSQALKERELHLKEKQLEQEERLRQQELQHQADLERQRLEQQKELEQKKIAQVQAVKQRNEEELEALTKKIRAEYQQQLQERKKEYQERLQEREQAVRAQLESRQQQLEQELKNKEQSHAQAVEELRKQYELKEQTIQQELTAVKSQLKRARQEVDQTRGKVEKTDAEVERLEALKREAENAAQNAKAELQRIQSLSAADKEQASNAQKDVKQTQQKLMQTEFALRNAQEQAQRAEQARAIAEANAQQYMLQLQQVSDQMAQAQVQSMYGMQHATAWIDDEEMDIGTDFQPGVIGFDNWQERVETNQLSGSDRTIVTPPEQ